MLCDGHAHVFDPARFPYKRERHYTPGTASTPMLLEHMRRIGAGRVVLVQPSVYGDDNDCLVAALHALQGAGRGVAVIAPTTTPTELQRLDHAGVRGARINLAVDRAGNVAQARAALGELARVAPPHWHIDMHVDLAALDALAPALHATRRTCVLDHFGRPDVTRGTADEHWRSLLRLLGEGRLYVKLSAPYLVSQDVAYSDLAPFVRSLAATAPGRLVWGTNWPHTQGSQRTAQAAGAIEPFRTVDDDAWRRQCEEWMGAAGFAALAQTAQRLYFA